MKRKSKYIGHLMRFLVVAILLASCEREPVVEQPGGADMSVSAFNSNVILLDTLIFSNPVVSSGQVRFDLMGTSPQIKAGDIVFYPGGDGVMGKVVTVTLLSSRMVLQVENVSLDQVFSMISVQDTISGRTLKSRTRTDAPGWNADTLGLTGFYLFNGFWQSRNLQVSFTEGRLYSKPLAGDFLLSGQGTDPWFDRYRQDMDYGLDISGKLLIRASGAMDASDSILIEQSVYGPFMVNGFPITYKINTWLGFHVYTQRDTVVTVSFAGASSGSLSMSYNYWDTWNFNKNRQGQSADIKNFSGPDYSSYHCEVFVNQEMTPNFCGEDASVFTNRLSSTVNTMVTIPNWQSTQTMKMTGTMKRLGAVFGSYLPDQMNAIESLLYSESQSRLLANQPPKASFVVSPPAGFTDTNFEFDASGCTDLETPAESLRVRWDFDGDNHFDTEFSTDKVAFRKFIQPGVYQTILEVRDEEGLTARKTYSVEVTLSTSAPIANFTVNPDFGRISTIFVFDASSSYDAEDGINQLKVRWDFDSDGIWDTSWSTRKAEIHVYPIEGQYVAKLEVLDTQGLTGSTTRKITVNQANIKPIAFFTVDPASGTTETEFAFDASGSSDPEDSIEKLQVRWDWENDGTFDTEYLTLKTIRHIFPIAGTYTVVLEVIDSEGYGSAYSVQIEVSDPNTPPDADFTIFPPSGKVDTVITFDASICTDKEDSRDQLEVRWDWNNDNIFDTGFTTEKIVKRTFGVTGTYFVRVQVRDSGGLMDIRMKSLIIN